MAVMEVLTDGHPALKKSCRKVRKMTDELRELACNMGETMIEYNGIGLAANQVGSDYRIITVYDESEENKFKIYVNPRIVKRSDELEFSDEGCLSFPMMLGNVGRCVEVEVVACDVNMKKLKLKLENLYARVFQHEIDHLNGITFVERAEEGTVRKIEPEPIEELEEKRETSPDDSGPDGETENCSRVSGGRVEGESEVVENTSKE